MQQPAGERETTAAVAAAATVMAMGNAALLHNGIWQRQLQRRLPTTIAVGAVGNGE